MNGAVIAGTGFAYPQSVTQTQLWDGFFAEHYKGVQTALAKRIFQNAGVVSRHAAVNPMIEDITSWPTARRMARYLPEAMPLGKEAIATALTGAGVDASEIGFFAVCSCTGYVTPGLDILLARDLGMSADTQRAFIGHMGCYAALPTLRIASDYVTTHDRAAVVLCNEVTSLHLQPPSADADQIVSHSLFADAAAAVVLVPAARASGGYRVGNVASVTDASSSAAMTWDVTDTGFRMGLSASVPDVLARHVAAFTDRLLAPSGLSRADVDGWAVHPGGPRILDVVGRELGLPSDALDASRAVLAAHGNCSSPTVLMVLDELTRTRAPRTVVMLAFGPGLTLYGAVLTASVR